MNKHQEMAIRRNLFFYIRTQDKSRVFETTIKLFTVREFSQFYQIERNNY